MSTPAGQETRLARPPKTRALSELARTDAQCGKDEASGPAWHPASPRGGLRLLGVFATIETSGGRRSPARRFRDAATAPKRGELGPLEAAPKDLLGQALT